ncbi:TonB-dependent receptor plug domain-containing protein [Woeseia oceani]|uniref:TonB-dependent receptor plug domain-containing protein n=1 Tax=Woeseia oceani TaxID=1548547 RepID=UPI000A412F58|nr:TonB-dependent receptor [Woeseia oceani]
MIRMHAIEQLVAKKEQSSRPDTQLKTISKVFLLLAAASLTGPRLSYAQSADTSDDQSAAEDRAIEQITVTGTRISRVDGYEDPTPVSIMSDETLNSFGSENIAEAVNTLPVFAGSYTPGSSIQNASSGTAAMNILNLRSLGTNRTLVLLDGRRVVPSVMEGTIDVNNIPQNLVKRVEVATGGASAVYGSDAVGGVVNFILDKEYTGLKGSVSGGATGYGDRENIGASLTGGMDFAGGRGHVVANVAYKTADGIAINDRPWNLKGWQFMYNPNYTPTNGQPERILLDQVATSNGIAGGIITNTALRGTAFGDGGTPYQFVYGDLVFDPDMRGGDWKKADVRGTRAGQTLAPEAENRNLFTHANYQINDNLEVYAELSSDYSKTYNWAYSLECNGCITIQDDNPFIPASVATEMAAQGITEFRLGTQHPDLGIIGTDGEHEVNRLVLGANGLFDAFGSNWSWDAYYTKGVSKHTEIADHAHYMPNVALALDAVRDPVTNEIVCRSTLTDPTNGCAPYNPMGIGVNTQAAVDFIEGAGVRAFRKQEITQDAAAFTVSGEPFSVAAGPISVAAGLAYKKDSVEGENDPYSRDRDWYIGGYGVANGSIDSTEIYMETVVPVLRDVSWADSLDLNGAVRVTDYSTSGNLTTWKVGATYQPVEGVRFRATQSRDARAPNLAELISEGGGGIVSGINPFTGDPLILIPAPRTGNPNLVPELADATGVGIVLQPNFMPEFSLSFDYWAVEIEDSIDTLSLQETLDRCFLGNQRFCDAIDFVPGTQDITEVRRSPFNYVEETAKGYDIEASYNLPILDGNLQARVLMSRYLERTTNDGSGVIRETAGENSGSEPPNWRLNASLSYATEPMMISVSARGISSGVYDNRYIECNSFCPPSTAAHRTTSDNGIASQFFFDAAFSYKVPFGDSEVDLFLNIRNVLDTDPTVVAADPGSDGFFYSPVNHALYDYLGRVFQGGFRVEF